MLSEVAQSWVAMETLLDGFMLRWRSEVQRVWHTTLPQLCKLLRTLTRGIVLTHNATEGGPGKHGDRCQGDLAQGVAPLPMNQRRDGLPCCCLQWLARILRCEYGASPLEEPITSLQNEAPGCNALANRSVWFPTAHGLHLAACER